MTNRTHPVVDQYIGGYSQLWNHNWKVVVCSFYFELVLGEKHNLRKI